jgi:hypothetical protein
VWQALHAEIEPLGATIVTVALDIDPAKAKPWIDAASPTHPSLIDTGHVTDQLFGFVNVPMAVWIDEHGTIVRPAELASIESRTKIELPDGMPERIVMAVGEVNKIPDIGSSYRAAILDWVAKGADSAYACSPDQVVARSQPRPVEHAEAAACFELGEHLWRTVSHEAAVPWWREAHRLFPENWTYKRQAWTLVTTPEGAAESDLLQGPNDVYESNWLDDVIRLGGGEHYYPAVSL